MDVTKYEEFDKWANGCADSTKYHKKSALERFCKFHDMNPRGLIIEAKEHEPEDPETAHLDENPADERLQDWYSHLGDEGVAKSSRRTYWSHIKSFYQKFGVNITVETPRAPNHKNEKPDLTASDVKKIVNGARSPRDRAIILCSFQGGMDPQEICKLDYGDVKEGLESDESMIPIWKTRQKSSVSHHTWLLEDAVETLRIYIAERKANEGILENEDPLFVRRKKNNDRISPDNIRAVMRDIRDRVLDEIPKAKRVDSEINPLSLKYLRRAFGIVCDKANVEDRFKEYWMGHTEPYNGAYSGNQIPIESQKKELKKVRPYLSITTTPEKQEKEISRLSKKVGNQTSEINGLKEVVEEQEDEISTLRDKLDTFRDVIVGDLVRDIDTLVTVRLEEISSVELNEILSKRINWYDSEDEWVCNYKNPEAPKEKEFYEPDLNELSSLELMKLKEVRDEIREIVKTHGK